MHAKPIRSIRPAWRGISALLAGLMTTFPAGPLLALPQGEQVRHGEVAFDRQGADLIIRQSSGKAIVNYGSFDIGSAESVRFEQPGASSAILNRVTGGGSSTIAGALLANGHVYLVNPAGILFSSSARVDVGGLVASALNLSDENFLSGKMEFSGGGGSVVNEGSIRAGRAFLIGNRVENAGTISAGSIVLGAANETLVIDEVEGGQIRLIIDGVAQGPGGGDAEEAPEPTTAAEPANPAAPSAPGDLPPAEEVAAGHEPVPTDAPTLAEQILNDPATRALVFNRGTLDASGAEGGRVDLAARITVQDGVVKADGNEGRGGTLNITATDLVVVTTRSQTSASAGERGDGGSITIFSPGTAILESGAAVAARGGRAGGDGGVAEVSGQAQVVIQGLVDLRAPAGDAGHLLIDPFNVTINNVGPQAGGAFGGGTWTPTANDSVILVANLLAQLELGSVTITTTGGGAQAGDITLASVLGLDDLATTDPRTLTLQAHNHININANITQSNPGGNNVANLVNLILTADSDSSGAGNVVINADVATGGGDFTASGVNFTQTATRNLDTGGGDVLLTQTGFINLLGNSLTTSGGSITMTGNADSTLAASVSTSGGAVDVQISGANNDLTVSGLINTAGGAGTAGLNLRSNAATLDLTSTAFLQSGASALVDLRAATGMTLAGDVATSGGDLEVRVTGAGDLGVNATSLLSAAGGGGAGEISILVNNGNVSLAAGSQLVSGTSGDLGITASGALNDITLAGTLNAGSGGLVVSTGRNLTHTGTTTSGGGVTQLGADMNFDGVGLGSFGGTITLNGSGSLNLRGGDTTVSGIVDSNGNNIQIQARHAATVSGDVVTDGGSVQVSASIGGAGNLTVTAAGLLDARLGAGTGIVTLSNGGGNILNDGELRSGPAGRVFMQAGGSITHNGLLAGGTEPLVGNQMRADNGITIGAAASTTAPGLILLNADFDNNASGNLVFNSGLAGDGGITLRGVNITGVGGAALTTQGSLIDVLANAAVDLAGAITANNGDVILGAGTTLDLGTGTLASGGGEVTLSSVNAMTLTGAITTSGGAFNADVTGAGTLSIENDVTTSGGAVDITTFNGLLVTTAGSDINAGGGAGTSSVRLESLNGAQNLTLGGAVIGGSGGTTLRAGNHVTLGGAVTSNGGDLILAADSNSGGVGDLTVNVAVNVTGAGTATLSGVGFVQGGTGTLGTGSGAITGTFSGPVGVSRAVTSTSGAIAFSGGATTLQAAVSGGGGVSFLGTTILGNGSGTLTSQGNLISVQGTGAVDLAGTITANNGDVTLGAGTTLDLGTGTLASGGGEVTLSSVNAMTLTGAITTGGGAFNADVTGVGTLSIENDITTSGGDVDVTTFNGLLVTTAGSDLNAGGGAGTSSVRLESLNGTQDLTLGGAVIGGSGGTTLRAGNHVTLGGAVTSNGGDLILAADSNSGGVGELTVNAAVNVTGSGSATLSGEAFSQGAGGTLTTGGGNVTGTFADTVNISQAISSNGGPISFSAPNGVTASAVLSSAPPSGGTGTLRLIGNVNLSANPNLGNADITLNGGGLDLVLNSPLAINGNLELAANRDVIVNAAVSTSAGRNLFVTADFNNAVDAATTRGGVLVQGAGSLSAGNHLVVRGAHLNAAGGAGQAVFLDTLGNTLGAGGNLRVSGANAPVGAGLRLGGSLSATGHVHLDTPRALSQLNDADITSTGGNVLIETGGDFTQDTGSFLQSTGGGDLVLQIGGSAVIESLRTFSGGRGDIALTAGGAVTAVGFGFFEFRGEEVSIVTTSGGLGTSAGSLQIEADRLAVRSPGSQFLVGADGTGAHGHLRFADVVGVGANEVNLDGTTGLSSLSPSLTASGTTVNGGLSAVTTASRSITVDHAITLSGAGSLAHLDASAGVAFNAPFSTAGGAVTVLGGSGDLDFSGSASLSSNGGSILLESTGALTMASGSSILTSGGNLRANLVGDSTLGRLDAGAGNLSLVAGSLADNNGAAQNLVASSARLITLTGRIGTGADPLDSTLGTLAANAFGGVYLANTGNLAVDTVAAIGFDRVDAALAAVGETDTASSDVLSGGNNVVLTTSGNLVLNEGTLANGASVRSTASGNVRLESGLDLDVNAAVETGGNLTLLAGDNLDLNVSLAVTGAGSTIDLQAGDALTMAAATSATTASGNVRVEAQGGDATVGTLTAGGGQSVSVLASGSIRSVAPHLITGSAVRLAAGNGVGSQVFLSSDQIQVEATTLAASGGAGGVSVGDPTALTLDTVGPLSVNRVGLDGLPSAQTDAALSGVTTASGGSLFVNTTAGALTVDATVSADGAGVASLAAGGVTSDLTLNADVGSATGDIQISAGQDIVINSAAYATGGAGTLFASAGRDLLMNAGSSMANGTGDLLLAAGRHVQLTDVDSSGNAVVLANNGAITDGNAGARNLRAASVQLFAAAGDIGAAADPLELETSLLAAHAPVGSLFLHNTGPVTVGDTPFVGFTAHSASGFPAAFGFGGFSDLTAQGSAVLVTTGGITVEDGTIQNLGAGATATTGNILLQTTSGDIVLRANLAAPAGSVSALAAGALSVEASQTGAGQTLDLHAQGGDLAQFGSTTLSTGGGNIRLQAANDLVLGNVNAGAAHLHAQAGNDIRMVAAGHLITADQARFVGGNAVGLLGANAPIETTVNTLAASAGGGGIHFRDTDSLTVGTTGLYGVNRVQSDASTLAQNDGPLSGHTTTANGSIVQRTTTGTLTVANPVAADGSGNIRLASGGGGDIDVNAGVSSGTGHVTVFAQGGVSLDAPVSTGGTGTLDVQAAGGAVAMTSSLSTGSGNARVQAATAVALGAVSTAGDVSVQAGTSITDANGASLNVTGNRVRLDAQSGAVGSGADPLETAATLLAARGAAGGVFLANTGAAQVDNLAAVSVNRVGPTAAVTAFGDAGTLNGIASGANGAAVLVNQGALTIAGAGVNANGSGNLLVQSVGGDLTLNAALQSGSGAISALASGGVQQNANIATVGNSVDVDGAGSDIVQAAGATTTTGGGNLRYRAGGALAIASLDAGAGNVELTALGGAVSEDGDVAVDVVGNQLRITGSGAGVAVADPLDTTVNTLAADVGAGGLHVENSGALTIGLVNPVAVNRVAADGTAAASALGVAIAGATATGSDLRVTTVDGDLTVAEAVLNSGVGGQIGLAAGGGGANNERSLFAQAPMESTLGDVSLKATGDLLIAAGSGVRAGNTAALWSDTDGDLAGTLTVQQLVRADNGHVLLAGDDLMVNGAGLLQAQQGWVEAILTTSITLGPSFLAAVDSLDLALTAPDILVDAAVNVAEAALLEATTGSILGTAAGLVTARSVGLRADLGDIGAAGNRFRINSEFVATDAINVHLFEADDTVAANGGLLVTGIATFPQSVDLPFYARNPDQPLAFGGSIPTLTDFLSDLSADNILDFAVGGDLGGDLLTAGTLFLDVGGNLSTTTILVQNDATIGVGNHMTTETLTVGGDASLTVGGHYQGAPGQLTVGGNLDAAIGGDLRVDQVDVAGATTLDVGGTAAGSLLHSGGDLNARISGDLLYTAVDADRNANLAIGGRAQGATLDVANNLTFSSGGDLRYDRVNVGGAGDLTVGGTAAGRELRIGRDLDLTVRRDLLYAEVEAGGAGQIDVGGRAEGDTLAVGGNLDLRTGDDLVYTSLASRDADIEVGGSMDVDEVDVGALDLAVRGSLTFREIEASRINASIGGLVKMARVNAGSRADFRAGRIQDTGSNVRAGSISLSARGDIGDAGRPINLDTSNIVLLRGNNVFVNNRRGGPTSLGLLEAVNRAELSVAGSLVDGNGDDLNVQATSALLTTGREIGTARDPLEINLADTLTLAGGRDIASILWGFFRGDLGRPPIRYGGPDAFAPGIAVLNGAVSLVNPELNAILLSAESYGDDLVGFKFRNSVFGDFYFLHLYLKVSELADDLDVNTIDYILYGRALVTPDPELPPAARNPIFIGGDEGN
jgi:filamentous hemagglutinin family protein